MPEPLIVCENLVKIYPMHGIHEMALQGLDLTVQSGEFLGLVGASGSGKTTLLNVLGGLDRPSAGRVIVGGKDLLKLSDEALDDYRRTQVGFVWQQSNRNLIPYLNAIENVELPLRLTVPDRQVRRQRASELLEAVGLSPRMDHLPAELSGGEQQRVGIAVALANQPSILLADEPTGEVDSATSEEIFTLLRKLNESRGMTTLIVSHDPGLSRHTERVIAIRDGRISTEIRHSVRGTAIKGGKEQESILLEDQQHEYDEWVVMDKSGRLQIPRKYIEELHLGERVRLEIVGKKLVIHPVAEHGRDQEGENERTETDETDSLVQQDLVSPAVRLFQKLAQILPFLDRFIHANRNNNG